MKWLDVWMGWVRRLPIARWIRPLWKGALKGLVKLAIDEAREEALEAIAKDGPRAVDRNVDALQAKIRKHLEGSPLLPDGVENRLMAIVQEKGDELQARLRAVVADGGAAAAGAVFDKITEEILARVDAL